MLQPHSRAWSNFAAHSQLRFSYAIGLRVTLNETRQKCVFTRSTLTGNTQLQNNSCAPGTSECATLPRNYAIFSLGNMYVCIYLCIHIKCLHDFHYNSTTSYSVQIDIKNFTTIYNIHPIDIHLHSLTHSLFLSLSFSFFSQPLYHLHPSDSSPILI